jgi:hypothetical protein
MTMLFEAFVIGLITLIIGKIGFYLTSTKKQEKDKEGLNYDIILFLIGFILHFIIEFIGLNKWYCDKCITSN